MPNCFLYVGLDVTSLMPITGSTATYALGLPNIQGLIGVHLFAQSAMLSPGSNAAGILSSNGLDLRIGR
jgi:hypothetical protein